MIGGVVEIAEDGRHLSLYRGFLKVSDPGGEIGRVPLDDITALILSAPQLSISKNVMTALLERKAVIVISGHNWHPLGMTIPIDAHYGQAGILRQQINLSEPKRKRLWQTIVKAKIANQATVLQWAGVDQAKVVELQTMVKRVRSGDPDNLEAQAARCYWPALMGGHFRRDRDQDGPNAALNYGYSILRAATARACVSAGLTPALGLHHQSDVNPFALVDDLMEPYRPLVDWQVCQMGEVDSLDPPGKRALVAVLQRDLNTEQGNSPLINCLQRLAQSLVHCLNDPTASLQMADLIKQGQLF